MNDDLMFDYLLQMGAMRPEQEELKRKQAMVEALRGQAMQPMQGQMVGKHYVAPGIANAIAQLGTAYMAGQQQKGIDSSAMDMNTRQRYALSKMMDDRRRKKLGLTGDGTMDMADYGGGL